MGKKNQSIGTETSLGWLVSGPTGFCMSSSLNFNVFVDNIHLSDLPTKFRMVEELPSSKKALTKEEQFCEDILQKISLDC